MPFEASTEIYVLRIISSIKQVKAVYGSKAERLKNICVF